MQKIEQRIQKLEAATPTPTEPIVIIVNGVWPGGNIPQVVRYSFSGSTQPIDRQPGETDEDFRERAVEAGKAMGGCCLMFALTDDQAKRLPADLGWQK
jgi:hypothetical protein